MKEAINFLEASFVSPIASHPIRPAHMSIVSYGVGVAYRSHRRFRHWFEPISYTTPWDTIAIINVYILLAQNGSDRRQLTTMRRSGTIA